MYVCLSVYLIVWSLCVCQYVTEYDWLLQQTALLMRDNSFSSFILSSSLSSLSLFLSLSLDSRYVTPWICVQGGPHRSLALLIRFIKHRYS